HRLVGGGSVPLARPEQRRRQARRPPAPARVRGGARARRRRVGAQRRRGMSVPATSTGWYVYGIVDADGDVEGVEQIRHEGLAALAAEVDLSDFLQQKLAERLNDRVWLEDRVRAHEEVLQRAAADRAVVPLRFGAIYDERSDVVQLLVAR